MPDIIKGYKIKIPKVTGNVSIIGIASAKKSDSNVYTITNNLANCTNSNTATSVNEGSPYSATVTPNSGYELMNIAITMGGTNVTSTVYTYQNGKAVINIPNVTENIVITVQATATSSGGGETGGGSDPVDGDVLSYMTYGKGINQTTGEITNNPECWATVDPFVVVTGRTYTISCDATWAWVYGFDEADNYTSQLVLGSNENPQNFTFTANSTRIRFGCYDPSHTLTYCNLTESSSSGGESGGSTSYTITRNLTNCTSSNNTSSVAQGAAYSTTVTPNSGSELLNVAITMGGTNVTSSVYTYQNGNAVINIPSVTGNVVITVQATATSSGGGETGGGSDPVDGDVLSYMTYGKGINQTTGEITNNPECWATVDPFVVVTGRTYTISCDATWAWVYGFDEADNYTSQLVLGSNENPQNFTFTANSTRIRFGCYDPSHTLTYCNLTESSSSGGESGGSTSYTITRNLTNCTSSNNTSSVAQGAAYSTTVTPNSGSELLNVAITMGGTNVTSSVYTYQNGNAVINIPSVTGNVVITVQASSSSSGGTTPTPNPPSSGGDLTGTYLFFGDSICAGGGSNGYGYPEAVKAKQPSMTAINYAVSGTCIAKNDSYDVNYPSILSRIQGSTPYADYVVLEGGFNDSWGQRNPLGTLKGGSAPTTADAIRSYSASLNAYQYTDALEKCICELKLKYWDKKIFFVIPHTVDAAVYANTYHSRAVEVCNKWGVIVIDLRNCGMPSHQDGTYNVDGTHPSAAGYDKYFAPNIINVLKANK